VEMSSGSRRPMAVEPRTLDTYLPSALGNTTCSNTPSEMWAAVARDDGLQTQNACAGGHAGAARHRRCAGCGSEHLEGALGAALPNLAVLLCQELRELRERSVAPCVHQDLFHAHTARQGPLAGPQRRTASLARWAVRCARRAAWQTRGPRRQVQRGMQDRSGAAGAERKERAAAAFTHLVLHWLLGVGKLLVAMVLAKLAKDADEHRALLFPARRAPLRQHPGARGRRSPRPPSKRAARARALSRHRQPAAGLTGPQAGSGRPGLHAEAPSWPGRLPEHGHPSDAPAGIRRRRRPWWPARRSAARRGAGQDGARGGSECARARAHIAAPLPGRPPAVARVEAAAVGRPAVPAAAPPARARAAWARPARAAIRAEQPAAVVLTQPPVAAVVPPPLPAPLPRRAALPAPATLPAHLAARPRVCCTPSPSTLLPPSLLCFVEC